MHASPFLPETVFLAGGPTCLRQRYRGGSGGNAYQYLAESTGLQDSWSEIAKGDYMRVINSRVTLDTSIYFYGTQFPLKVRTNNVLPSPGTPSKRT